MIRTATLAALATLPCLSAAAQDAFALNGGVALTTNYIFRGATQSDDRPAVQGYVEGAVGTFFGGIWASTVDFPQDPDFGDDNVEIDLYFGLRPDFGDLAVELNYTRYLYDRSGDCCGEFGLILGHPVGEVGELGFALFGDPGADTAWAEVAAGATLFENYAFGGGLGTDFGTLDHGRDKFAWQAGVARGLGALATIDLRYHDSNVDPGRLVLTLSLDI